MSKKKVALNNNPLESQTIGKIKKHNFAFFTVLIVMVIFGCVIFFLPEINSIYENYKKTGSLSFNIINQVKPSNNVVNNTVEPDTNETTNSAVVEPTYSTLNIDTVASFTDVLFNGIRYDNNQAKVNIIAKGNSTLVLGKLNYFMLFYNRDKELIKTYFFSSNVTGQSTVSINVSGAVYYNIVSFTDSDYPYMLLDVDESDQSYLTCTRNNTEVTYTFKHEKLTKIKDIVSVNSPSESSKIQYAGLKSEYEMVGGVQVEIKDETPYKFIMNIDMENYNGNIKNYYFTKDSYPREVKYKLEAMDFTCR